MLSSSEVLELAAKVLSKEEDLLRIPRGAVETLWCVCFFFVVSVFFLKGENLLRIPREAVKTLWRVF